MIGTAARGAVFALAGVLVIEAAVTYKPSKAGGIDKALLTLRNQPFGEFLLILAALGLIIFGVYGLCEARWRQGLSPPAPWHRRAHDARAPRWTGRKARRTGRASR